MPVIYDENIRAKLVRVPDGPVMIPSEMGVARENQMQGTQAEQLCELASRVCYDSLGTGRSSVDFHEHISQVKHFSTIEHAVFTAEIHPTLAVDRTNSGIFQEVLLALFNRPQLRIDFHSVNAPMRVTFDLRHLVEWDKQTELSDVCQHNDQANRMAGALRDHLLESTRLLCPMILANTKSSGHTTRYNHIITRIVPAESDNEKHYSAFLAGGRGFSHEQVRHRFGISQKSSRFCDDSESPIIEHPLISEYLDDGAVSAALRNSLKANRDMCADNNRVLYRDGVKVLQSWLEARGIDKTSARKQARGAMRNDLGNGLVTELIFTASLVGWKHMFSMRATSFADAEIREVFCRLLPEFQKVGQFTDYKLVPAPDGLGHCAVM